MGVLIWIASIFLIYCFVYFAHIDTESIYVRIYDSSEHVKVIEKSLLWITIAHIDMHPEKMLTLKFIIQYARI